MKKIKFICLIVIICFFVAGCSNNASTVESDEKGIVYSIEESEKMILPILADYSSYCGAINPYDNMDKITASSLTNQDRLRIAYREVIGEETDYDGTLSSQKLQEMIKKLFGKETEYTPETFEICKYGPKMVYEAVNDEYMEIGETGCCSDVVAYDYSKVVSSRQFSDRIEIIYVKGHYDPDKKQFFDEKDNPVVGIPALSETELESFDIKAHLDKFSQFKFTFKKEDLSYYFYSLERLNYSNAFESRFTVSENYSKENIKEIINGYNNDLKEKQADVKFVEVDIDNNGTNDLIVTNGDSVCESCARAWVFKNENTKYLYMGGFYSGHSTYSKEKGKNYFNQLVGQMGHWTIYNYYINSGVLTFIKVDEGQVEDSNNYPKLPGEVLNIKN